MGGHCFCSTFFLPFSSESIYHWAWKLTPVVPAAWEAEAEGSCELSSSRPAWATQKEPISKKQTKTNPPKQSSEIIY
jgi:hypothetical protein